MNRERGFTLPGVVASMAVLVILAAMGIPQLLDSRSTPQEAAAVANLRLILTSEILYASTQTQGEFGTLNDLTTAGLLDPSFESGSKNGYLFQIVSRGKAGFSVTATPRAGTDGQLAFFGDETGVIRVAKTGPPHSSASPALGPSGKTILIPRLD